MKDIESSINFQEKESRRFIKFIPSEESDYLLEHYPNAFLLLCLIAQRARRISGKPDGLEIGEAKIGDYKKAGIASRQQYRTALNILVERATIKICENCRTRKKSTTPSTTGSTTIGTKVKLLRSDVWDINSENENKQKTTGSTTGSTTDQPPTNHRPTTNKNSKIVKIEERQQPQTPKESVVVVFSCLQNLGLSDDDKLKLMKFSEERIKLAVEFSKFEKPKKSLIAQLIWHCKARVPPVANNSTLSPQMRLAHEFNNDIKGPYFEANEKSIIDGHMVIYIDDCYQSISLKKDQKYIVEDFRKSKEELTKLKHA